MSLRTGRKKSVPINTSPLIGGSGGGNGKDYFYFPAEKENQEVENSREKCIILDLDETLVHTNDNVPYENLDWTKDPALKRLSNEVYQIPNSELFLSGNMDMIPLWGVKRPHLDRYLKFLRDNFVLVGIWSAGQTDYVNWVVRNIFPEDDQPDIVWTAPECEMKNGTLKPLRKMISKYPELKWRNTLFLDDRSSVFRENPDNGIQIPAYSPNPVKCDLIANDFSLLQLEKWLSSNGILEVEDVRTLDKSQIFSQPIIQPRTTVKWRPGICKLTGSPFLPMECSGYCK